MGDTATLRPDMKLSSETQGSFNCADHDIKIGSNAYNHSRFGNIPIEVTSSTSFVETSGNAEWNYNGSSWVVTVQKDIPFVASNGTVAGFDRVHSNNPEENKNKNSCGGVCCRKSCCGARCWGNCCRNLCDAGVGPLV